MAEHVSGVPAYQAIFDDLNAQIMARVLAPDQQLPTEQELSEQWSCAPSSARHALIALRNLGLVRLVPGQAAIVSGDSRLVRAAYFRHQSPRSLALDVEHSSEHTEAPAEVAERLGIDEGAPVSETVHKIGMGGQPVSFSICWEPLAITGGTDVELPHEGPLADTGLVRRMDTIGYRVDAEEEALRARMPEQHEAVQLGISREVPVIEIWQIFWADDTPVQVSKIIFRSDRYDFHYRTSVE